MVRTRTGMKSALGAPETGFLAVSPADEGAAAPAFNYLRAREVGNERLVDQTGIEPVTS
jgi:hypothetical protein